MFELLDIKWGEPTYGTPSSTINWENDLSGLTSTTGNVNDLVDALNDAFNRWEDVAAVNFTEGGSIDLSVSYASFSTDSDPDNDGAVAVASWSDFPGLDQPQNAEIEFNSDELWAPNGAGGTNFYTVALHEIGHIIGLAHPNPPDASQIMNFQINPALTDLSDTDIEGAQFIYGTDGDDVVVDGGGRDTGGGGGGGGAGALGLLVGILALVASLFTGGAAGAVAMAAGMVPGRSDDDAEGEDAMPDGAELAGHAHCHHTIDEDGTQSHYVYYGDDMGLPMVDFTARANPCGCVGLCEHILDMEDDACATEVA